MTIKITNLIKVYNEKKILDIAKLTISNGINFIIGNNGSGKTTLFKIILNLSKPSKGYVMINDKNIIEEEWKKYTSAFLDDSFLIPFLSCKEFFDLVSIINNVSVVEREKFVSLFSDFLGEILNSNKKIGDFSTGDKTKVGIASCFLGNNSIIILDEPFANLDPYSQAQLEKILVGKKDCIILLTSHHMVNIMTKADKILLIENGVIKKDMMNKEEIDFYLTKYFVNE